MPLHDFNLVKNNLLVRRYKTMKDGFYILVHKIIKGLKHAILPLKGTRERKTFTA